MKRILINETEKNEILNQHKDFKKILEEKKINLDKGLMIEQRVQDPIFLDKFTISQVIAKCVTNPNIKAINYLFKGKPAIKVNSGPDNVKVYTNEPNTNFGGYNSYILNTDETKILKGPMSWKCSKLYADEDAQAAAAKKAEEDKKAAEQSSLTTRQQAFIKTYTDQGYVVNPEQIDFRTKKLKRVQPGEIPELESLFPKSLFPKGLNIYQDLTTISGSTDTAFTERAASMSKDVNTCKQLVEKFWKYYQEGEEGDLQDTLFLKLRTDVQSCLKWYPKWDGLEGGALGIGTGQNHLNNIIDVLTGKKTEYKGSTIPSRTTGYLLTPGRKSR
mgnify:CR=1 FL=1|tara:strand:+ start:2948 stop:3940 length:993 start_codon:yes stop_codon:yes gene_type:complete